MIQIAQTLPLLTRKENIEFLEKTKNLYKKKQLIEYGRVVNYFKNLTKDEIHEVVSKLSNDN